MRSARSDVDINDDLDGPAVLLPTISLACFKRQRNLVPVVVAVCSR